MSSEEWAIAGDGLSDYVDAMAEMEITFLGTGTSVGIPMIGCQCPVCTSEDPRDRRDRCSIYVKTPEMTWVVDTGPDFRRQCLREGIMHLDAALLSHAHTDHIMGFDDLRRFTLPVDATMPVYATAECMADLKRIFSFAFNGENRYPSYLKPDPRIIEGPFQLGETTVTPLPVRHGKVETIGFLFARGGKKLVAYMSDCKEVLPEALEAIEGVDTLIVDALRYKPHPTHMNFDESLALVAKVQPRQTWFVHFNCDVSHIRAEEELPKGVAPAYDGLQIEI